MKLKELIAPSLKKAIIFFVLLFLWTFAPVVPVFFQVMCITTPCNPIVNFVPAYKISGERAIFSFWSAFWIALEISILYLAACFIAQKAGK